MRYERSVAPITTPWMGDIFSATMRSLAGVFSSWRGRGRRRGTHAGRPGASGAGEGDVPASCGALAGQRTPKLSSDLRCAASPRCPAHPSVRLVTVHVLCPMLPRLIRLHAIQSAGKVSEQLTGGRGEGRGVDGGQKDGMVGGGGISLLAGTPRGGTPPPSPARPQLSLPCACLPRSRPCPPTLASLASVCSWPNRFSNDACTQRATPGSGMRVRQAQECRGGTPCARPCAPAKHARQRQSLVAPCCISGGTARSRRQTQT